MTDDVVFWQDGFDRLAVCVSGRFVVARRAGDTKVFGWGLGSALAGGAFTFDGAVRKAFAWVGGPSPEVQRMATRARRVIEEMAA